MRMLRRKISAWPSGKPARDCDTIQLPKREGADRLLPGGQSTTALFQAICFGEGSNVSRGRGVTVVAIAAICGACCLGCGIAGLLIVRYQPAVIAAPGHEMHWPTRPGPAASLVKSYQRFFEIRPCEYMLLGWSADGALFYREACRDSQPQVWACDLEKRDRPHRMEVVPLGLAQETVPRSSILEMVRSPGVRPADAEPTVRSMEVRADGLASPDGHWVAVVVRHVYGPEDVIVLSN